MFAMQKTECDADHSFVIVHVLAADFCILAVVFFAKSRSVDGFETSASRLGEAPLMDKSDPAGRAPGNISHVVGFFRARWWGEAPLDRLFWRDMLLVGTAISVASSALALVLLGLKLPLWLVLAAHVLPVPYNIFLTIAVWRTAEKTGGFKAQLMMLGSALWLIATVIV